jgi:sensor histidine kinase YesM
MKYLVFAKEDSLLLFILYPYFAVVAYLLMGDAYFCYPTICWATLVAFVLGTASWVTHIVAANILRYTISNYNSTFKRILVQLPVYFCLTNLLGITLFFTFSEMHYIHHPFSWHAYKANFFGAIVINVLATSSHEGLMFFYQWKKSLLETERLKKSYLQSQLDSLKNQVNPHFLFNSLNCLSSLISSDPERASEFLDEMSLVYRYLLRSNEYELIPLAAELQFVHSFFHMLKTRYDEGIELKLDISDTHKEYFLPPLTLQMLVENAIKHNLILKDRPLRIRIFSETSDWLTITNNIQKKSARILSNKIGLQNIVSKYRLLNNSNILIHDDGMVFSVSLPLIKKIHYESIDH